jgi:Cu/Ag efflux protein CusF
LRDREENTVKIQSWSGSIAAIVVAAALGHGCATSKEQAPPPKEQALPSIDRSKTVTATATVKKIDLVTREVTLVGDDGNPFTFVAGPDVRNLDQVRPGDTVKVTYTKSLAVSVKRGDGSAPDAAAASAVERSQPGEKPGGAAGAVVVASAKIVAIDRATNRVTLVGPEGNYHVLEVQDPKNLENVQVGDMVYATYTESIGVSVEPILSPTH